MLTSEEIRVESSAKQAAATALAATTSTVPACLGSSCGTSSTSSGPSSQNRPKSKGKNKQKGGFYTNSRQGPGSGFHGPWICYNPASNTWATPRRPSLFGPPPQQNQLALSTTAAPLFQSALAASPSPLAPSGPPTWDSSGLVVALNDLNMNGGWVVDSGASTHMTSNNGTLLSFRHLSPPYHVTVGNGASLPASTSGHSIIHSPSGHSFALNDVLYVPTLIRNLLFDRKFTRDNSCSIEFDAFGFSVKDFRTKAVILRCNSSGDLYTISSRTVSTKVVAFLSSVVDAEVWHRRLGHPGRDATTTLQRVSAIPPNKLSRHLCHACQIGKHVRLPFSSSTTSSRVILNLYTVICGHHLYSALLVINIT